MSMLSTTEKLKNRKAHRPDIQDVSDVLEQRLLKLHDRLPQFDQWNENSTPEMFWGNFITFLKRRNVFNRRQYFCQNALERKKLVDCLNKCDRQILFETLPEYVEEFQYEIAIEEKRSFFIDFIKFFFENFNAFRKHKELTLNWSKLIESRLQYDSKTKIYSGFKNNLSSIISPSGHGYLYKLFEQNEENNFHKFLHSNIIGSPWIFQTQFMYALYIQRSIDLWRIDIITEDEIESCSRMVLEVNNRIVQLISISYLILSISKHNMEDADLRENIRAAAISYIGDPHDEQRWYISNEQYIDIVGDARKELIRWQNEKIAIQFFEAMSFYPERKRFWLSNIRKMDEVKITIYKPHIETNARLMSLYKENRNTFILSQMSSVSAILMKHSQYLFVEFSEHGNALYIFRNDTREYQHFESSTVSRSTDFKDTFTSTFRYGLSEGKLSHHSGWENIVRVLLKDMK